jgi:hypothetical protein
MVCGLLDAEDLIPHCEVQVAKGYTPLLVGWVGVVGINAENGHVNRYGPSVSG